MRKFAMGVILAAGMIVTFNASSVFAQENTDDKFSFGKVVSVTSASIVVKEYDFAKDADVEMTYAVTAETELGNVNAVTDLVANDDVVIDYADKDSKRVVLTLVKEDKGAEAPAAGEATEQAPAAPAAEAAPAEAAAPAAEAAPAEAVAPEAPVAPKASVNAEAAPVQP
ncbi:MAG: hypothetical protein HQL17_05020 [Candidatus Omnitrophica bacterium]|nr:hypothetical protein [Candidatus Omnitrophota bacterium]